MIEREEKFHHLLLKLTSLFKTTPHGTAGRRNFPVKMDSILKNKKVDAGEIRFARFCETFNGAGGNAQSVKYGMDSILAKAL